jgi:hypothetical protein
MKRKEFLDLLGIVCLRGIPIESLHPSELEKPYTKYTLELEIANYLEEVSLDKAESLDSLKDKSCSIVSAWDEGVIFLLDGPFIKGKTFIILCLCESDFYDGIHDLRIWPGNKRDYRREPLPVWRFTEKALAELTHPEIAAEYMALVSADAEDKRLKREAERIATLESEKKSKAARLADLKAEMEAIQAEIESNA